MPLRHRGATGFEYADTNKSQNRNIYAGEAGFNSASGIPNGHRSPSSFVLPQKDGGISSYTGIKSVGTISANGAMGINFTSLINDSDGVLIATGSLLASISLSMNGSGTLNSGLLALLNLSATLQASGDLNGSLNALAYVLSTLNGDGSLSLTPYSTGNLLATITTSTELSPQSLSEAVWSALATENNVAGTMGNKLNGAASAGDPWGTVLPDGYVEGTAGYKLGNLSTAVSGAAPVSIVSHGFVLTTGIQTGTYTDTTVFNSSYHQIEDLGNVIDCYYIFNIGSGSLPVAINSSINLRSGNDTLSVYGYDFLTTSWVEIGVITGKSGTGFDDVTINTLSSLVGIGANEGEVRIRFAGPVTDHTLRIDYLTLGYSVIGLNAQQIADGVWNSLVAGHITADSMGVLLKNIEEEVLKRLKKTEFIALK
jgi:adhesin HecA-like repeat protein